MGQLLQRQILAVVLPDVLQRPVDPGIGDGGDGFDFVKQNQQVFQIGFRQRRVVVPGQIGVGGVPLRQGKENVGRFGRQRPGPEVQPEVAVHFDGRGTDKVQKGMVHPGIRLQLQLKAQVLGEKVEQSRLQRMGDPVQQHRDAAAVKIIDPIDGEGLDVPVVVLLDAPPVVQRGDGIEHEAAPFPVLLPGIAHAGGNVKRV